MGIFYKIQKLPLKPYHDEPHQLLHGNVSLNNGFEVACGGGTKLHVTAVLPEGKGRMKAEDFVHGRRIALGDMLKWEM